MPHPTRAARPTATPGLGTTTRPTRPVRVSAKRVRPNLPQLSRRAPLAETDADGDGPPPPTSWADWGALAADDPPASPASPSPSSPTIDPDVAASINELATIAARAMLAGDERALRPGGAWHGEVMALGDFCSHQARADAAAAAAAGGGPASAPDPSSPGMQGALLAFLLLEMAEGRWPAAQADALVGPWRAAAERLHGIVEDAGWKLSLPDEEVDA